MKRSLFRVLVIADILDNGNRALYQACLQAFSDNVRFFIRREDNDGRYAIILIYDLEEITENDILQPAFSENYAVSAGSLQKSCRWVAMSYAEAFWGLTYNNDVTSSFSTSLMSENYDAARNIVEHCIEKAENIPFREAILMCLNISLTLSDVCRKLDSSADILSLPDVITFMSYKTLEQAEDFLRHDAITLIDQLAHREAQVYRDSFVEMKQYIRDHYCDIDFSFQSMADSFDISLSALSKRFNAYAGMTLIDYTTELRMSKSKELLLSTDMSINEISMEVGYLSANSFIRRFKQLTGLSPGEYRKNGRSKKE